MASKQNIAQYPNGFSDGVVIRGLPVLNTYSGQIWWVDSNGAQIGDGKFNRPFATIDQAINHASAGDTILVKAGHTETLAAAAGIDADVAGISIIGLGQGRRRPTISFSAATADVDIDAANITIQNMVFDFTGVASLTAPIDVNAADFTLQGCELIMSSGTNQAVRGIVGATAADRMKIVGNTIWSTTAGATSAINLVGTADGTEIKDNYIVGDFSTAAVENAVGNVLTNLLIDGNYIRNDNAGDWAVKLVSACTGAIQHNTFATDAIATAVDWGSCVAFDNLYFDTSDTDSNGTPIPLATTTGGASLDNVQDALIGADGIATMPAAAVPANNVNAFELLREIWAVLNGTAANENGVQSWPTAAAYANNVSLAEVVAYIQDGVRRGSGTTMAANKSVADAIGFDGNAVVAATAGMLRTMAGTTFVVKKTLTSSAVVQAGVDVTAVSTTGDILIEAVYLQTNGTGLATGTNFTLETNNTNGKAVFLTEGVAQLGANATIASNMAQAGLADAGSFTPVLETGKKVIAKSTVADCTGAGTVDVYLVCRRLADNATLAAA